MVSEMEIIWTKKARLTYFCVLDYLKENWTKQELIQFSNKTEVILKALTKKPYMFVASGKHKNIRKAIIDKNNSLFYQVDKKNRRIYLLTFFDNRQNPKKLKFD
jgi:plasmid stabilization system protein ParE